MPRRAERSGFCRVELDVSPEGAPFNIRTTQCSDPVFSRATVRAVQTWRYRPKISGGSAVARMGVRNIVRFDLLDERGRRIPE